MHKACLVPDMLGRLRDLMKARGVFAVVVPNTDSNLSEYAPESEKRRAALSGFTGSAGEAAVTLERAALWTDGRYWGQAERQLDLGSWELQKQGQSGTPAVADWLACHVPRGERLALCTRLFDRREAVALRALEGRCGIQVVDDAEDLAVLAWGEARPVEPLCVVSSLGSACTARGVAGKMEMLREEMKVVGAEVFVTASLSDFAWLLNVRGGDVVYTPVVRAFLLVHREADSGVELFWDTRHQVPEGVPPPVASREFGKVYERVRELSERDGRTVWLDPNTCNAALFDSVAPASMLVEKASPLAPWKASKDSQELSAMKEALLYDGAAASRWLAWLETVVHAGATVTELEAARKLADFMSADPSAGYCGKSFATISAYGPNAAMAHYEPEEVSSTIENTLPFLCDFGGQYSRGGTTDTTRTVHLGTPTIEQKRAFTVVLKSHIALSTALFPAGTSVPALDAICRSVMWRHGMDYNHGTGHGVGAFLSVHESPIISAGRDAKVEKDYVLTIEPGLYLDGQMGIRIENMAVTKETGTNTTTGKPLLCFEVITRLPLDRNMIDVSVLSQDELRWLNDYHASCVSALSPFLRDSPETLDWLARATQPLA